MRAEVDGFGGVLGDCWGGGSEEWSGRDCLEWMFLGGELWDFR